MAYIKTDVTGRITAASLDFHCGEGEIEVAIPANIPINTINAYLYIDGEFIYKPEQDMDNSEQPEGDSRLTNEVNSVKAELISMKIKLDAAMMKIAEQADEIKQLKES